VAKKQVPAPDYSASVLKTREELQDEHAQSLAYAVWEEQHNLVRIRADLVKAMEWLRDNINVAIAELNALNADGRTPAGDKSYAYSPSRPLQSSLANTVNNAEQQLEATCARLAHFKSERRTFRKLTGCWAPNPDECAAVTAQKGA
jgi:hypothetical protein